METEKSKRSDNSMVADKTKNSQTILKLNTFRTVSNCAKKQKNYSQTPKIRTLIITFCALALFLIFAQNNKALAQPPGPSVTRTIVTYTWGPNNTRVPNTVTIRFFGMLNTQGNGYDVSFAQHADWVDAIYEGFTYYSAIGDFATGLGAATNITYDIWFVDPLTYNQASDNDGSFRINFDANKAGIYWNGNSNSWVYDANRNLFNSATEGTAANSGSTGQFRDHDVNKYYNAVSNTKEHIDYNWRNQIIHELGHLLGIDAGVNAAGTAFDTTLINQYRSHLYNGTGTSPAPGDDFLTNWNIYNGVWFDGGVAYQIFNDNPLDGASASLRNNGDQSGTNEKIPLGTVGSQHPVSPEALLNHLKYQDMFTNTMPLMGWDVKTEYARNFLTELELAMLLDSNQGNSPLDPEFELQQHFGMSIYQQHGGIDPVTGLFDPYELVYDWDVLDHLLHGSYQGPGTGDRYEPHVADFAIGLHIVSGGNKLSFEGILQAGREEFWYRTIENPGAGGGPIPTGRYTVGIRVENYDNWLSIKSVNTPSNTSFVQPEVSGQFGIAVASGSDENRDANFTLINRGTISSIIKLQPIGSSFLPRIWEDAPLTDVWEGSSKGAYPLIEVDYGRGLEKVLDKNEIRAGIYLDAWASQLNFIGTGKLYNGIFVDNGVGIKDGVNLFGENGNVPVLHGNFINWNTSKGWDDQEGKYVFKDYDPNAIMPSITFGRRYLDDVTGNAAYTVQYIDARTKDDKLVAVVLNKATGLYEVIGTGHYEQQMNGTQLFVADADADAKYKELIANAGSSTQYGDIETMKISSGIEDITTPVGDFFGELYGQWQVEIWGGLTNFYIPNQTIYSPDGRTTDQSIYPDIAVSSNYRIHYENSRFIIGADDVGAKYLNYDPNDRRQGAGAELHLNEYCDLYDATEQYRASQYSSGVLQFSTYIFHQEVVFGSKNNTGSILSGISMSSYGSSAIFQKGIDNWITITDFRRIDANGQPEHIYRIWNEKDDKGNFLGVDFNNHNNTILQGLFRNPEYLTYLNDKDHWDELAGIILQCHDDLSIEITSDLKPDGIGAFDKVLGPISIFNRYSGVIQNNGSPDGIAATGIFAEFGIWNDRDYSAEYGDNYGQIVGNVSVSAGTFLENYGVMSSNIYIAAGSHIYNAFDAVMSGNGDIHSGADANGNPVPDVFTYIVNAGDMSKNDYIVAGTDLINLKTGVMDNTYSRITAQRDLYNFGIISNTAASYTSGTVYDPYGTVEFTDHLTHNPVDGGIFTRDGNIYNLDNGNLNDDYIGRMLGNRHIVARASSGNNVERDHYVDRDEFGTSGSLINEGKILYTFGIERRYESTTDSLQTLLASIETTHDLINLNLGVISDTTEIKVGRDFYNEVYAETKNTAYLNVTKNLYNRDAGKITNTSFLTVNQDLHNEGWGVIDTGTKLLVKWNLFNGNDLVSTNEKPYPLTHLAVIKNFATIQVDNGSLLNGQYGLITDNNTIISHQNVTNYGIIERFFNFDAQQSLTNKTGAIFSVAQDAVLSTKYTITNEKDAHLFVFGDVKANQIVNDGIILGTGSIIMNNVNSKLENNGHIAPGGGLVLLPYSDEENQYFKTYGSGLVGELTLYGEFVNNGGTFDITINPHPDSNPINTVFDPVAETRALNTTKATTVTGRTDGSIGANDVIFVRGERDSAGNLISGGEAIINGGDLIIEAATNLPGAPDPARYYESLLPFLATETKLTVNKELNATLPNEKEIVLFDFLPKYDENTYFIDVKRRYKYGNVAGQTYNQRSVGKYIDAAGSNPNPNSDFFLALIQLDNLSDPENIGKYSYDVRKVAPSAMFALNQLSGAIYATMETASFQNNSIILSQLADYLRSDPLLTYCKDCRVYEPSKLDLWAATYGTLGGSDHDGNAYGYDQSTGGTIIGFDRLYIKQTRVGIFGTFGSSTYNTDLLEKSKATDISAGLYARKDLNRGYLLGSIGFGYTDYHTTRRILFANQRAKSDRDAYFWSAYIERALDLDSQIGRIQPYIGAQYIGNQFNNFNETGAGTLSLQGGSSDAHSLRSILGARFTRHPRLVRGGKLETFLNFDWKLEFLGYTKGNLKAHFTNPNSENFAGSGSFHVYGNKQNRSWLDAGIGSNWDRNNTRISLGYNIGINGNGFFLHTGNIAFTYAR